MGSCPNVSVLSRPSTNRPTTTTNQLNKMAAILAGNNVEQEYLWSCTLTGSNKEYKWSPENDEGKKDEEEVPLKASHRLLVKSAILMPSAKKDEVTVKVMVITSRRLWCL